jgi:hypothetical protein
MEKYFFNTFGYLQLPIPKTDITIKFEEDISRSLSIEYIGDKKVYKDQNQRTHDLRNSNFINDEIYNIFYNNEVLNKLKTIVDDFIILSPIESFYLYSSQIHRDFCGQIKTIKILFYLDDVSDIDKGPLYVIPGTQFIYDKYSSSIGNNVSWPPGVRNNLGAGYNLYNEYLNQNIPKKYLFSNKDNIIFFNNTLLHGSDGNLIEKTLMRRAIGMTVIMVDKNNKELMNSIENIFSVFNIKNKQTLAYLYCQKNKETCGDWLNYFYENTNNNSIIEHNLDGNSDKDGCKRSNIMNRFKHYTDHLENVNDELNTDTIFNCYLNQLTTYDL